MLSLVTIYATCRQRVSAMAGIGFAKIGAFDQAVFEVLEEVNTESRVETRYARSMCVWHVSITLDRCVSGAFDKASKYERSQLACC